MPSLTKIQTGFLEPQGAFELDPGTAGSPGLFFSGNTSTGMFSPSTGVLGFSTGSTQNALTILANGNVGIGETNPTTRLNVIGTAGYWQDFNTEVNGYISLTNTAQHQNSSFFSFKHTYPYASIAFGADLGRFNYRDSNNSVKAGIGFVKDTTHAAIAIGTQGSVGSFGNAQLIIRDTGNVGIGTTNPLTKLHLHEGELQITSSSAYNTHINYLNTGSHYITMANGGNTIFRGSSNGVTSAVIYGSGNAQFNYNVGIGTDSPQAKLHLASGGEIRINNSSNGNFARIQVVTETIANAADLTFHVGSGEALRIANGGNVGIGTTNPQQKLSIYGNVQINNTGKALYLNAYPGIQDNTVSFEAIRADFTTGASVLEISTKDNNNSLVRRFRITDVGNVSISSTITVPNTRLEVSESNSVNQPAISSGANATSGSFSFATRYSGENADYIANILSTNYSTGRSVYGHGVRGARENETAIVPSTIGFVSTFDNFSGHRTAITQHTDGFIRFFNSGSSLQTTVGSEVVMSERLTIGATGNVGIGTTNPFTKLDTRGVLHVGGGNDGIWLGNAGDNAAYDNVKLYYTGYNGGAPRIYLTPRTKPGSGTINTYLHLLSNTSVGANNMGLLVDGNVGIGTANPYSKLEVRTGGTNAVSGQLFGAGFTQTIVSAEPQTCFISNINDQGGTGSTEVARGGIGFSWLNVNDRTRFIVGTNSNHPLRLYTNATEKVRITETGNVGIGTNNPTEKLDVRGNIVVDYDLVGISSVFKTFSANHSASNRGAKMRFGLNDGGFGGIEVENVVGSNSSFNSQTIHIINHNGGVLGDIKSLTARYDGNVGIGLTNPAEKLDVGGSIRLTGNLILSQGGQIYTSSTSSVAITPNAGDWINIARIPYGTQVSGEIIFAWSGVESPSCCHHGHMRFELGSSHGPLYNYQWASSLKLVEAQSHNDYWLNEARLIMYSTGGSNYLLMQVKSSQNVSAGSFKVTLTRGTRSINATTTIELVTPVVDNTQSGSVQRHLYLKHSAAGSQRRQTTPHPDRIQNAFGGNTYVEGNLSSGGKLNHIGPHFINYGLGVSYPVGAYTHGSSTRYIGQICPGGVGNSYLHVKISLVGGSMFWVHSWGYMYNGAAHHNSYGWGYEYNNTIINTGTYDINANRPLVLYRASDGSLVMRIYTAWPTSNAWGYMAFEGGCDGITTTNQNPMEILSWTHSSSSAAQY